MAVEVKRGCGYRKVGGLYLVGSGLGFGCDRLPIELTMCPCCGHGIKQTRGFTWVDVPTLVGGNHIVCSDPPQCSICHNVDKIGRAGLLWIGAQFYPTAEDFEREARSQGWSRRIHALPKNFKLGETWILFAHPRAIPKQISPENGLGLEIEFRYIPGIFHVSCPQRIERIFKESDRGSEKVAADEKRGITPVFVPDDDVDHK